MTDTDLVVPVRVHALVVNETMRRSSGFKRWEPDYVGMIYDKLSAEPAHPRVALPVDPRFEGVHLQWELPEALTSGYIDTDTDTGENHFPLVPNRWLVVRYAGPPQERSVTGWVVHSDFLRQDYPALNLRGSNGYLSPRATSHETLAYDEIGRVHSLADGPWVEPERREPFLTAVGPGLPVFAAFQPYHKNVFSLHDTLNDLMDPKHDLRPPATTLSYLVVGWYSEDESDLLVRAPEIPSLLPPDAEGLTDLLAAIGWRAPADLPAVARTVYAGTTLGVGWDPDEPPPDPDRPDRDLVRVSIGHSAEEAVGVAVSRQAGNARSGNLMRALLRGTVDTLDEPRGDHLLERAAHQSWFLNRDGGHAWEVVPRPRDDNEPAGAVPPAPNWLADLNEKQVRYDDLLGDLDQTQWRVWTLHWLRNLPGGVARHGTRPPGFNEEADQELDPIRPGSLAHRVSELGQQVTELRGQIPYGDTDDDLQAAADRYATEHGLPDTLMLRREPRTSYHTPGDPVVVLHGAGNHEPLTRDHDDPLPVRLPSDLLTAVVINGVETPRPDAALAPDLTGLPAPLRTTAGALLAEFALLDKAVLTPAGERTALDVIADNPAEHARGPWPEYTHRWRQAWRPLYLEWNLRYCPTPYLTGDATHWTFDPEILAHTWNGTGATPGGGEANLGWNTFFTRATLAPSVPYVARAQLARYLATYPHVPAAGLRALRNELSNLDMLSQTLDGFNDWLLQRDGTANLVPEPGIRSLVGTQDVVPIPGVTQAVQQFQPVRAGQLQFFELNIIDRFGRTLTLTSADDYRRFILDPAPSMVPDHPLNDEIENLRRFAQLPPRILHATRVHFGLPPGASPDRSRADEPGIPGWLLINHLDQSLLVYAPNGQGLGTLRVTRTREGERITWTELPFSPYPDPDSNEFADALPHLVGFVRALRAQPPAALTALLETIDTALDTTTDDSPQDDGILSRLAGRPVALVRAHLRLELASPPLTNPSWNTALHPPDEDYPDYDWPIRLGDPYKLQEGLIGYFGSPDGPGGNTDYTTLHALRPAPGSDYIDPIGNGEDLALPARPPSDPVTHQVILLMDPHRPVHAITDILPDQTLQLDAEAVHRALANIGAVFRLAPLLATTRVPDADPTRNEDGTLHLVMPRPSARHGTFDWAEPRATTDGLSWTALPLLDADVLMHPDDPPPLARAGYLRQQPPTSTREDA